MHTYNAKKFSIDYVHSHSNNWCGLQVYFQPFYLVELDPQMDWGNASQIKEKLGQSGWKDYALMYSDYMAWLVH